MLVVSASLTVVSPRFDLAQECLHNANDFGGLLLLATSSGNRDMIGKLATSGADAGQNNVAFMSHYIRGDVSACLDLLVATGRLPEAAFFARTHLPARLTEVVAAWKDQVAQVSEKASKSLADPEGYPNLFPNFHSGKEEEEEEEEEHDDEEVDAKAVAPPTGGDDEDDVDVLEQEIDKLKVGEKHFNAVFVQLLQVMVLFFFSPSPPYRLTTWTRLE